MSTSRCLPIFVRPLFDWTNDEPITTLLSLVSAGASIPLLTAKEEGYIVERDHPLFNQGQIPSFLEQDRVVKARYGNLVGQERYVYVTSTFAMGSSSMDYGAQDQTTHIKFACPGALLPEINIYVDDTDNPYGITDVLESDGHSKPSHLRGVSTPSRNL